MQNSKLMII